MKTYHLSRSLLPLLAAALALALPMPPLHASEMDSCIESASRESHVFKSILQDEAIRVASDDGVVTLTGTVSTSAHRSLAQDTVENLPGVQRVDNQLQVSKDSLPEKSDKWLIVRVRLALLFHGAANPLANDITSDQGTVTLRGKVSSLAQKDQITDYVRDVDGVNRVINKMTVSPTTAASPATKIDDASITAQTKAVLLMNRSTSALRTRVHTADGTVTLEGTAANAAQKALVTRLVRDVRGVSKVVNSMTIPSAG